MIRASALVAALSPALLLAACETGPQAPTDPGVCYHAVIREGEEPRFNVVARDQPNIESCAARLEELRLTFARNTGVRRNVTGVYQGRWLFVTPRSIRTAESFQGPSFVLLVRAPDGLLVMPGAVEQPPYDARERPAL
jgi:hypothetical protein